MESTVSITVTANNHGAAILRSLAAALADEEATPRITHAVLTKEPNHGGESDIRDTEEKQKRTRRTKAEVEAERAAIAAAKAEQEVETDTKTLVNDDTPAGGDLDLGFDEVKTKAETPALTVEKDLIPAFKKYAEKHDRSKAAVILTKYSKTKSVYDIPSEKYTQLLKELRV